MRNDGNATSSPNTKTSNAKTADFAANRGVRFGTASRLDRIEPVEYSPAMTSTPSTQIVNWPNPNPLPRMKLVGSATILARCEGSALLQLASFSQANNAVSPGVRRTSSRSDHNV